jgi:hypothetical protein
MNISSVSRVVYTGQMSDGSDRQAITVYDVTVVSNGKTYFKTCNEIPDESTIDLTTFQDITPPPTNAELYINQLTIMSALADMYTAMAIPTTGGAS